MFKGYGRLLNWMILSMLLLGLAEVSMASIPKTPAGLAREVRHELLMLPNYGVFDNLAFTIEDNDTVVLTGQVMRPALKSDAEAVVRRIRGVERTVNNIEVLPFSSFDDSIRLATYRAIFSKPGFEKYAIQADPPIKIIVKNGNITLDGVVDSQMDKTVADIAARSVPGTFSVTDNLIIG